MLLPPPDISAAYVDSERRPSKDFFNWIKSLSDSVRGSSAGGPFTSVKDAPYQAVGDGDTDDTAAIQAAVNATGNGVVFFPPGGYLVSSPIVCTEQIVLLGCGRGSSALICGDNDCTILDLDGRNSTVRDLGFNGSTNFGATNPLLIIRPDCDNCQIENNFFQGGRYNILNLGTDNTFFQNELRYAYGSALMKSAGGSGNFILRNKMDQVWPHAAPSDGYTINAWAATTGYAVGDVVETAGWHIQCVSAGTSGGAAPTLLPYETDIIDGSVTWQIASPTTYYSYQMDSGASENFMNMNDHSGCFTNCVGMTDTGDDGGSGKPFFLWIDNAIMGQHSGNGLHCGAGSCASISNSEIGVGWDGGNGVATELDWDNGLKIADNLITGSASGFGVKLYGASNGAIISDNLFQGNMNHAVKVDGGGGHIEDFQITDNVTGGHNISIDNDTDWFIVSHNNTHGGGVSNASGGGNFLVADNL